MYFSCSGNATLGYVKDDGTGPVTTNAAGGGTVYDLATVGGKIFAPDFNGEVIRRLSADLAVESTVTTPTANSNPDGIVADGVGNLWVTENATGKVARFPAAQADGTAKEFTPTGGTLTDPFGIAVGADGYIYVAGQSSGNIARISPDGSSFTFYPMPAEAEPFNIVNGADGDLWVTDRNKTRVLRFVNGAPVATTGAPTSTAPTSTALHATVNPRGNETQVIFDYGTTTDYGSSTAPIIIANGADPVDATFDLAGLKPSTTYHFRARATNAEGAVTATDATFTTLPPTVEFSGSPKSVRVSSKGKFRFPFTASPGTDGKVSVVSAKPIKGGHKKSKLKLGTQSFTVPAGGKVKPSLKVPSKSLKVLEKLKKLKCKAQVVIGAETFTAPVKLKAPKGK